MLKEKASKKDKKAIKDALRDYKTSRTTQFYSKTKKLGR